MKNKFFFAKKETAANTRAFPMKTLLAVLLVLGISALSVLTPYLLSDWENDRILLEAKNYGTPPVEKVTAEVDWGTKFQMISHLDWLFTQDDDGQTQLLRPEFVADPAKLTLAKNEAVPSAAELSMEQAVKKAREEYQRLVDLSVCPDADLTQNKLITVKPQLLTLTDPADGDVAFSLWQVSFYVSDISFALLLLDARTGLLYHATLVGDAFVSSKTLTPSENSVRAFANYLDVGIKDNDSLSEGGTYVTGGQDFWVYSAYVPGTSVLLYSIAYTAPQRIYAVGLRYDPYSKAVVPQLYPESLSGQDTKKMQK